MKNWKTSLFGSTGILTALFDIVNNFVLGTPENINWTIDIPILTTGIGLLFAKDAGVTGGSIPATIEAGNRLGIVKG